MFSPNRTALLLAVLTVSMAARAAVSFVADGVSYQITGSDEQPTVAVTAGESSYSGHVIIPATVDYGGTNYTVSAIAEQAFTGSTDLTAVIIGNNVEDIGHSAFYGCTSLKTVHLGNAVKTLGSRAFYGCTGLSDINWVNSVRRYGNEVFANCTALTAVVLGSQIEEMGSNVFSECLNIATVTVNEGCRVIGTSVFNDCKRLKSISIPNSVTTLGPSAFAYCTALAAVTIGNGVRTISERTFVNCSSLETVTLGNQVQLIDYQAFYGCDALGSITINTADVPTVRDDAFNAYYATLHVPAGAVNAYAAHPVWGLFEQLQPIADALTLTIVQAEGGSVSMAATRHASYTLTIEAEAGWRIHSVTWNGDDVTAMLDDNVFTTPAMQDSGVLRVAFEAVAGGVRTATGSAVRVYGQDGAIVVQGTVPGDAVSVYATDGRLVSSLTAAGSRMAVSVPTGAAYIVKVGGMTLKVAL